MLLLLPLLVASSSAKSPYVYQADPMARVAMEHRAYTGRSSNPYMVGEQFFKKDSIDFPGSPTKPWEEGSHGYEGEQLPYTTMQNFGSYERRHYPAAMMACTYDRVDNAADPLANMERANPWAIMMARRFHKTPSSIMFHRLYKYISGVNQAGKEVFMTRPVVTLHQVVRSDRLGNVENQMMCFYLPSKYQQQAATGQSPAEQWPAPMPDSRVHIFSRPAFEVYVRTFGGFALTARTWEEQRRTLEDHLIGKKVKTDEFLTASYNSPMQTENRRNEVWIQAEDLQEEVPDLSYQMAGPLKHSGPNPVL